MATQPKTITKRQDPLLKPLKEIPADRESPFIWIEGVRLLREALQAGLALEYLILRSKDCAEGANSSLAEEIQLIEAARERAKQVFLVNDSVLKLLSDVETPQGVAAVFAKPRWTWDDLSKRAPAPVLILDSLQNPGNAASILRTAEAAGAAGVVTTPGTARLFSPKAIRGAMGSSFRLPVLENHAISHIAQELSKAGYELLGTSSWSDQKTQLGDSFGLTKRSYMDVDWSKPWAIILGQEGGGLSDAWNGLVHQHVYIPMQKPVESLNVAAAAAVLLYAGCGKKSSGGRSGLAE